MAFETYTLYCSTEQKTAAKIDSAEAAVIAGSLVAHWPETRFQVCDSYTAHIS